MSLEISKEEMEDSDEKPVQLKIEEIESEGDDDEIEETGVEDEEIDDDIIAEEEDVEKEATEDAKKIAAMRSSYEDDVRDEMEGDLPAVIAQNSKGFAPVGRIVIK